MYLCMQLAIKVGIYSNMSFGHSLFRYCCIPFVRSFVMYVSSVFVRVFVISFGVSCMISLFRNFVSYIVSYVVISFVRPCLRVFGIHCVLHYIALLCISLFIVVYMHVGSSLFLYLLCTSSYMFSVARPLCSWCIISRVPYVFR